MNILFVCNQNKNRSKTAEELFRDRFNTKSAGLYNNPINNKNLSWADTVVVMENSQINEISKRFPELSFQKRILSLDIPDIYNYNQPELIKLIESKMKSVLETINLTTL